MSTVKGWSEIPYSVESKNALVALKPGQVLAVRMKKVDNTDGIEKVQIEFAEKIRFETTTGVKQAFTLLNKSNANMNKARRCWETAMPQDALDLLKVFIPDGESSCDINKIMDPMDDAEFRLRITEKKESEFTTNEKEYAANHLKQNRNEDYFYAEDDGQRVGVFTNLVVVDNGIKLEHILIPGTYAQDADALDKAMGLTSNVASGMAS